MAFSSTFNTTDTCWGRSVPRCDPIPQSFQTQVGIKSNTFLLAFPLPHSHRLHVANLKQLGSSQAQLLSLEAHEALGNCDPSSELDHPSLLGSRKSFSSQGSLTIPPANAHILVPVSYLSGDPLSLTSLYSR